MLTLKTYQICAVSEMNQLISRQLNLRSDSRRGRSQSRPRSMSNARSDATSWFARSPSGSQKTYNMRQRSRSRGRDELIKQQARGVRANRGRRMSTDKIAAGRKVCVLNTDRLAFHAIVLTEFRKVFFGMPLNMQLIFENSRFLILRIWHI